MRPEQEVASLSNFPILFSGPMVRAILEGRKTQTRRVVARSNTSPDGGSWGGALRWGDINLETAWVGAGPSPAGNPGPYLIAPCGCGASHRLYPPWRPGDTLWVRETWAVLSGYDIGFDSERLEYDPKYVCYRATDEGRGINGKWRPSIHMPRWACRLFLRVKAVRVERVQDIILADCAAEGAPPTHPTDAVWDSTDTFRALWDSLNAKRGYLWASNPFVWVLTFTKI